MIDLWLDLPSPDPVWMDNNVISWSTATKVGGLRWAHVRYRRGGMFDLDPGGSPALLVGAWEDPPSIWRYVLDPLLIDIVAVNPEDPKRCATLTGNASFLGEVVMGEARSHRLPLPCFRDPVRWLQAEGRGVVPINGMRFALACCGYPEIQIVGEDIEHAKQIRRLINRAKGTGWPSVLVEAA